MVPEPVVSFVESRSNVTPFVFSSFKKSFDVVQAPFEFDSALTQSHSNHTPITYVP